MTFLLNHTIIFLGLIIATIPFLYLRLETKSQYKKSKPIIKIKTSYKTFKETEDSDRLYELYEINVSNSGGSHFLLTDLEMTYEEKTYNNLEISDFFLEHFSKTECPINFSNINIFTSFYIRKNTHNMPLLHIVIPKSENNSHKETLENITFKIKGKDLFGENMCSNTKTYPFTQIYNEPHHKYGI